MSRELKPYDELSRTGKRYRDDPDYREAAKEYSRKKAEEVRQEKLKEKRNYDDERSIEAAWEPKKIDKKLLYNSTAVADMVNVTNVTIYNWNSKDILPEPTYIERAGSRKIRMYSKEYINSLRNVLKNRLRGSLKKFKENLNKTFIRDGIINVEGENIEFKNGADKPSDSNNQNLSPKNTIN